MFDRQSVSLGTFSTDLTCSASNSTSVVTVDCSGGRATTLQCSFDGGPLHSCRFYTNTIWNLAELLCVYSYL